MKRLRDKHWRGMARRRKEVKIIYPLPGHHGTIDDIHWRITRYYDFIPMPPEFFGSITEELP